jgi:glycerol-3-phosphate dehydrogenase (NAD(P)+)
VGTTVGVIGAGAWGTTLAALLTARSNVRLWAREPEVIESMTRYRENRPFLDGFKLPEQLTATNRLDEALDGADVVVVAIPSQFLRATMIEAHPFVPRQATVLSVAKGIEQHSGKRMTEVLSEVLVGHDLDRIGVLSGPNLAREIIAGQPAATCVAFEDPDRATSIQGLLGGAALRVYTSDDVIGCEIGGATKNVIAIAAGVADGLGFGTNTKAALITRGLAELTRLGVALGGQPLTFLGLAGNGDLIATCSSPLSRNRRFGEELATGRSVEEMIGTTNSVAEGVDTAPALLALAGTVDVEMPISNTVAAVLRGDVSPKDVVAMWMGRPQKPELHGLRIQGAWWTHVRCDIGPP